MSDEPYRVGKNRPPLHTRFKKGEPSANPRGSRKAGPMNLSTFFEQSMSVTIEGKAKKVHPLEATMLSLVDHVIKRKDMRAADRLLQYWAEADLIYDPNDKGDQPTFFVLPASWTYEEWAAKYKELGPPPWPGRKNGLDNSNWKEEILYEDD